MKRTTYVYMDTEIPTRVRIEERVRLKNPFKRERKDERNDDDVAVGLLAFGQLFSIILDRVRLIAILTIEIDALVLETCFQNTTILFRKHTFRLDGFQGFDGREILDLPWIRDIVLADIQVLECIVFKGYQVKGLEKWYW